MFTGMLRGVKWYNKKISTPGLNCACSSHKILSLSSVNQKCSYLNTKTINNPNSLSVWKRNQLQEFKFHFKIPFLPDYY